MESSTNRNPTAYTGNEIVDRREYLREYSLAPYITKFVSIRSAEEKAGGGLILSLDGNNGEKYAFELERASREKRKVVAKGENVRRQFLDDVGVWDIFDNIWDIDYRSLEGKRIEVFVDRKKDYVVAVSPIFMPLQNEPNRDLGTERNLENILSEKLEELKSQDSEINRTNYESLVNGLFNLREYVQNSVRETFRLKITHMQLSGKTEAPEIYYEFINEAARVLEKTNKKLRILEPRSFGLGRVLEEIRDSNDSNGGNGTINDSLQEEEDRNLEDFLWPENPENEQDSDDNF